MIITYPTLTGVALATCEQLTEWWIHLPIAQTESEKKIITKIALYRKIHELEPLKRNLTTYTGDKHD